VVWTSIYFATSVIWLAISGFLLYESFKSEINSKVIIGWAAVSGVIAVIDFAGIITFGVDHYTVQSELDYSQDFEFPYGTDMILVPLFMMLMCARGFYLWIMNIGLVIYLGVAACKS